MFTVTFLDFWIFGWFKVRVKDRVWVRVGLVLGLKFFFMFHVLGFRIFSLNVWFSV